MMYLKSAKQKINIPDRYRQYKMELMLDLHEGQLFMDKQGNRRIGKMPPNEFVFCIKIVVRVHTWGQVFGDICQCAFLIIRSVKVSSVLQYELDGIKQWMQCLYAFLLCLHNRAFAHTVVICYAVLNSDTICTRITLVTPKVVFVQLPL